MIFNQYLLYPTPPPNQSISSGFVHLHFNLPTQVEAQMTPSLSNEAQQPFISTSLVETSLKMIHMHYLEN